MTKDHSRYEARSPADRPAVLEKARTAILARMPQPLADNVLALHPAAAKRYAAKVVEIKTALTTPDGVGQEAMTLARELISAITVTPREGRSLQLVVTGDLAVILEQQENNTAISMVAGPGLEPGTYGL
jgi:hypothetical protein